MSVCPFADQTHRYDRLFPGAYTGGPDKGVLHTTEGPSLPGYKGGSEAPHLTLLPVPYRPGDWSAGHVTYYQHFDTDRPARALVHASGQTQTNNDGVLQYELVGTCQKNRPDLGLFWPEAPQWAIDGLAKALRWGEADRGIPANFANHWLSYPDSYGTGNGVRMTARDWDAFAGWCGHLHVPENDHGDPGLLPVAALLPVPAPSPSEEDEMGYILHDAAGAFYLLQGGRTIHLAEPKDVVAARNAGAKDVDWSAATVANAVKAGS